MDSGSNTESAHNLNNVTFKLKPDCVEVTLNKTELDGGETQCYRPCNVEACRLVYASAARMITHWTKCHFKQVDKNGRKQTLPFHYMCSFEDCRYHRDKFFLSIRNLRQHYVKVHAEKRFTCHLCERSFGTEKLQRYHEQSCGTVFKCSTCACQYNAKEALLTHCSRHNHPLPDGITKLKTKQKRDTPVSEMVPVATVVNILRIVPPICEDQKFRCTNSDKPKCGQSVKTILPKPRQKCYELVTQGTQTESDSILDKAIKSAKIPTHNQASQVTPKSKRSRKRKSSQLAQALTGLDEDINVDHETQTLNLPLDWDALSHISTQTLSSFLLDSTGMMLSAETQTPEQCTTQTQAGETFNNYFPQSAGDILPTEPRTTDLALIQAQAAGNFNCSFFKQSTCDVLSAETQTLGQSSAQTQAGESFYNFLQESNVCVLSTETQTSGFPVIQSRSTDVPVILSAETQTGLLSDMFTESHTNEISESVSTFMQTDISEYSDFFNLQSMGTQTTAEFDLLSQTNIQTQTVDELLQPSNIDSQTSNIDSQAIDSGLLQTSIHTQTWNEMFAEDDENSETVDRMFSHSSMQTQTSVQELPQSSIQTQTMDEFWKSFLQDTQSVQTPVIFQPQDGSSVCTQTSNTVSTDTQTLNLRDLLSEFD